MVVEGRREMRRMLFCGFTVSSHDHKHYRDLWKVCHAVAFK